MIKKIIKQGEEIPKGYGLAWYLDHKREFVCYPYGLHLLFVWIRNTYLTHIVYPKWKRYISEA